MDSFSTSFWNENNNDYTGFDILCRKLKTGKHMSKEYVDFLRHRAHVQENYGKALVKLSKLCGGKEEIGSLRQAWDEMSARTESVGLDNIALANDLNKEANALLEKVEIDRQKRKQAEAEVVKLQTSHKNAIKKVSELKRNYFHKSKHSEQIGQTLLAEMGKTSIHPKEIDKLKMKHTKSIDAVNEAEVSYKESLATLEECRKQWEKETIITCQIFEELEKHRIKYLRDSFWSVSNLFSTYVTKEDDNQEGIRSLLENLDFEGDIKIFIQENKTGKNKPMPIQYESYTVHRGENLGIDSPLLVRRVEKEKEEPVYAVVNKKKEKLPPDYALPNEKAIEKPVDIPQPSQLPAILKENVIYESSDTFEEFAWRVLETYEAQSDFEMTLSKDEYVRVINKTHREWWQVKTQDGKTGYFPSVSLEYGAHTDVV